MYLNYNRDTLNGMHEVHESRLNSFIKFRQMSRLTNPTPKKSRASVLPFVLLFGGAVLFIGASYSQKCCARYCMKRKSSE